MGILSKAMKAKYEPRISEYETILADFKRNEVRIGEGLTTAFERYKHYKAAYAEREAECERYRVMLEEVGEAVRQDKQRHTTKRSRSQASEDEPATSSKKLHTEETEERKGVTDQENTIPGMPKTSGVATASKVSSRPP